MLCRAAIGVVFLSALNGFAAFAAEKDVKNVPLKEKIIGAWKHSKEGVIITFAKDGTYEIAEGNEAATEGKWTLDGEKKIKMVIREKTEIVEIIKLTDKDLVTKEPEGEVTWKRVQLPPVDKDLEEKQKKLIVGKWHWSGGVTYAPIFFDSEFTADGKIMRLREKGKGTEVGTYSIKDNRIIGTVAQKDTDGKILKDKNGKELVKEFKLPIKKLTDSEFDADHFRFRRIK